MEKRSRSDATRRRRLSLSEWHGLSRGKNLPEFAPELVWSTPVHWNPTRGHVFRDHHTDRLSGHLKGVGHRPALRDDVDFQAMRHPLAGYILGWLRNDPEVEVVRGHGAGSFVFWKLLHCGS